MTTSITSTVIAPGLQLHGDPEAIRDSGRRWRTAAMACAAPATDITTVTAITSFLGDESDTWRTRHDQTVTLLGLLATARDIVGGALVAYADQLDDCQQQLRAVAAHHTDTAAALQRWQHTPTAEPAVLDDTRRALHDLDARAIAVQQQHRAAVRNCSNQIQRATNLAPSPPAGTRSLTDILLHPDPPAVDDIGRPLHPPMSIDTALALDTAARHSTTAPTPAVTAADTPPADGEEWLDPATKARYRDRLYQACLSRESATTAPTEDGILTTEMACGGFADSAVMSRQQLLAAARIFPYAIDPPKAYGLTDLLADTWNLTIHIMIGGCLQGGSVGACLFDIASMVFPPAKGAKAVKVGVEIVEDGTDVIRTGEKAVDTGRAAGETRVLPNSRTDVPPRRERDVARPRDDGPAILPGQRDARVQHGSVPDHASNVLETIDRTGRAPTGYKGGRDFDNDGRSRSALLPDRAPDGAPVTYREWDVNPKPKPNTSNRGEERIVTGSDGSAYFTGDHYRSFLIIRSATP